MEDKAIRYNQNKLKWSLVDFKSITPMVEVLMYGAHKYSIFEDKNGNTLKGPEVDINDVKKLKLISSGANNWKKGLPKEEILESAMRHLTALIDGEQLDPESKLKHIGHLMCNCMFYEYMTNNELSQISIKSVTEIAQNDEENKNIRNIYTIVDGSCEECIFYFNSSETCKLHKDICDCKLKLFTCYKLIKIE